MRQTSFLTLGQQKKLKCERFLDEMKTVVPWEQLTAIIAPYYKEPDTGRKKKELIIMLKIYFLQQWYGLSDPGMEEAIYDRNSFQKFLEIDLLSYAVPDETTILNFRHLLEEQRLQKKLFKAVNRHLENKNITIKNGTIVDATIIAAPSSTKNEDKKRDEEMSSTKKGNKWHFGMKAHIGVDSKIGIVHTLETTTAKVHDSVVMEELLHGEEEAVFGDKGYANDKEKKQARAKGVFWGILDKAKRNHALSSNQQKRNKKLSSIRAIVEHPFQVIKCQWKYTKVRYKGLLKNSLQLYTLFALYNLFKMRRNLLQMVSA
ncbi:MAG: IS5 family transposase [Deltaproteobacteria bacterium]|nr:IS5 family transposase [Deltaproteobacteria bacterium]